jgi:adenine phosphoribosyltransferase
MENIERLRGAVRDVPDFPKAGIVFKDITPILASPELFKLALDALTATIGGARVNKIVGIDARGFIFGAPVADRLNAGFIPMRKKGKLPHTTASAPYSLEYGEAEMEIHRDAIQPGDRLFLVDDLLATGGTAGAAVNLIKQLGGDLIAISFLIELTFLNGRDQLDQEVPTHAILSY